MLEQQVLYRSVVPDVILNLSSFEKSAVFSSHTQTVPYTARHCFLLGSHLSALVSARVHVGEQEVSFARSDNFLFYFGDFFGETNDRL